MSCAGPFSFAPTLTRKPEPLTPTPSNPSSPNSSRYVSLAGTQANSPTVPFRSFPPTPFLPANSHSRSASIDHVTAEPLTESPADEVDDPHETARKKATHVPSPVARAAEKAAGIGAAAFNKPAQGLHDASLRRQVKEEASGGKTGRRRSARDEYDLKGEPAEVGQPDDRLQAVLNGLSLEEHREGQQPTDTSEETGDAVIRAARHRNADVRALLGGKDGLGDAVDGTGDRRPSFSTKRFPTGELKINSDHLLRDAQGHEYGGAPEDTGALMLDVSGYKLESEKDEEKGKLKGAEQELRDVNRLELDESTFGLPPYCGPTDLTYETVSCREREGGHALHPSAAAVDRSRHPSQPLRRRRSDLSSELARAPSRPRQRRRLVRTKNRPSSSRQLSPASLRLRPPVHPRRVRHRFFTR